MTDNKIPLIVDPGATFGETITVNTAQVLAFQEGMQARITRQVESINRLLKERESLQAQNVMDADEIARLSTALTEEHVLYNEQRVLLDRAREERDQLLDSFSKLMAFLRDLGFEHTREGMNYTRVVSSGEVDAQWDRHADLATDDPVDEIRTALPPQEERPNRHLAG